MEINPDHKRLSWSIKLLISVDTLIQSSNHKYFFKIYKDNPEDVLILIVEDRFSKDIVLQKECGSLRLAVLIVESKYNMEYVNKGEHQ